MSGLAKKRSTETATITIAGPRKNVNQVLRLVKVLDFKPAYETAASEWRAVLKEETESYGEPGAALKGARLREGLSQVELAKMCQTTQGAISAMERGRRSIGKRVARRLAMVLNTHYRSFL